MNVLIFDRPAKWNNSEIGSVWNEARAQVTKGKHISDDIDRYNAFDGPLGCVLVFPHRVQYQLAQYDMASVMAILEAHLLQPQPSVASSNEAKENGQNQPVANPQSPQPQPIKDNYVFVCVHNVRGE